MLCQLHDTKDVKGKINFSLYVIQLWKCMKKWRYRSTYSWNVIREPGSWSKAASLHKNIHINILSCGVVVVMSIMLQFPVSAFVISFALQLLYPEERSSGTHWTRRWEGPRTNHYILKTYFSYEHIDFLTFTYQPSISLASDNETVLHSPR